MAENSGGMVVPDVSVCIVNWNTREHLRRCLQSLREHAGGFELQVIVVDNASTDDSGQMVRQSFPDVCLVVNDENVGYAAANNQALAMAEAELALLLNPDVMLTEGALGELVACLGRHEQAAGVAPKLVYPSGRLQYSCRTFPTPDVVLWETLGLSRLFPRSRVFGKWRMSWWGYDDERPVDQPMASALLLRREALDQVGPFDESFPIFFNDVDLCKRLWDAGWEIWFAPRAVMVHEHAASTAQVPVAMAVESHRSFVQFYRKHYRGRLSPLAFWGALALLAAGLPARVAKAAAARLLRRRRPAATRKK